MWSPSVCEEVVTHEEHRSGQHQLLESEVQPQAEASLPVGANQTLLIYTHTHTGKEPVHTHLPSSFKALSSARSAGIFLSL